MLVPDYLNYKNHYSPAALWEKLKKSAQALGKNAVRHILILYYVMTDPNTPFKYKAMIAGALGYLIFPIDMIPDAIPVVGYSDDMAAIMAVYKACQDCISPQIKAKAEAKLSSWFS